MPPQAQEEMATYLTQVPLNLRKKATRLAAGGATVVTPVEINDANELVSLLPEIPPSFKPSPRSRKLSADEAAKLIAQTTHSTVASSSGWTATW